MGAYTKITFEGVTYPSISACAKSLGVCIGTLYAVRRRLGLTTEEALHHCLHSVERSPHRGMARQPVVLHGHVFRSWRVCIAALGLPYRTVKVRVDRGLSWGEAIDALMTPETTARLAAMDESVGMLVYNGRAWPSLEALAEAHGVGANALRMLAGRLRLTPTEALDRMLARMPVYAGRRFTSVSALCRWAKVSAPAVHKLMKGGLTAAEAVDRARVTATATQVAFRGRTWPSMAACARAHGVNPGSLRTMRCSTGLGFEQLMEHLMRSRARRKATAH